MRLGFLRSGVLGALLAVALSACSSLQAPVERTLLIGPAPVACAGDPPATCLQVSEPNGNKWLMRYDEIEGFVYEPGFSYEVVAEEPPLDAEEAVVPRLHLVLIRSKEPAPSVATVSADASSLDGRTWRLEGITSSDQDDDWPAGQITLDFHVAGAWANGFSGCNTYVAGLTVDGDKITISMPATTLMLCPEDVQRRERRYLEALYKAQSYTVTGDALELTLSDGAKMQFRSG
ncbi:MAG: META domain-containing protein [Pseudomonadota bacterium]